MITENLSTLKINKLSQAQYERELAAGRIDASAIYLTPDNNEVQIEAITNSEIDEIFGKVITSISYSLGENGISSNMSEGIYNGNSYITVVDAINGYKITNVQILMNNVDITSNVYSDNIINIPVVTGNVEIIVSTRPPETYTITYNLTNCSSSNTTTTITEGQSYSTEITCSTSYYMQDCTVSMSGGVATATRSGGRKYIVEVPEATGNITITGYAD